MAEGARLESVFTGNRNVGSNPTLSASPSDKYLIIREYYLASHVAPHRAPHHGAIRCQVCLLNSNPSGAFWGGGGHLAYLDLPLRKHLRCASRWWGWTPPHMDRRMTLPPVVWVGS